MIRSAGRGRRRGPHAPREAGAPAPWLAGEARGAQPERRRRESARSGAPAVQKRPALQAAGHGRRERSVGDGAARSRFTPSLTIGTPHWCRGLQFAPKVMAHLTASRSSAPRRLRARAFALAAWPRWRALARRTEHLIFPSPRARAAPHLPESDLPVKPATDSRAVRGVVPDPARARGRRPGARAGRAKATPSAAAAVIDDPRVALDARPSCAESARLPTSRGSATGWPRANAAVRAQARRAAARLGTPPPRGQSGTGAQSIRRCAPPRARELRRALRADPIPRESLRHAESRTGSDRAPPGSARARRDVRRPRGARGKRVTARRARRWLGGERARCGARLGPARRFCAFAERSPRRAWATSPRSTTQACVDLPTSTEKLSAAASGPMRWRASSVRARRAHSRGAAGRGDAGLQRRSPRRLVPAVPPARRCAPGRPTATPGEDSASSTGFRGARTRVCPRGRLPGRVRRSGFRSPRPIRALLAPGFDVAVLPDAPRRAPRAAGAAPQRRGGPTFRKLAVRVVPRSRGRGDGRGRACFRCVRGGHRSHDTRVMLFLLPRMVLAGSRSPAARASASRKSSPCSGTPPAAGRRSEMFMMREHRTPPTILHPPNKLSSPRELPGVAGPARGVEGGRRHRRRRPAVSCDDVEHARRVVAVRDVLHAVPRELLARAALRCGAPARALLYFEDHLRARKNVLNQAALRDGEPGRVRWTTPRRGLCRFPPAPRSRRARSGRASAVAERQPGFQWPAPTGAALSSDALAATRASARRTRCCSTSRRASGPRR